MGMISDEKIQEPRTLTGSVLMWGSQTDRDDGICTNILSTLDGFT